MSNKLLLIVVLIGIGICSTSYAKPSIEESFKKAGLVDVQIIVPSIQVDLVNTDASKNFFRKDFYGVLTKAYIRPAVAQKLKKAQAILKKKKPGYSLLILDAARPHHVQEQMYNRVKGTPLQKYIANAKTYSMHNYGCAVDITIVDEQNDELDMGLSPFRKNLFELGILLVKLVVSSKPSKEQKQNRALLKEVMKQAGFYPIASEWWHFNGFTRSYIRKNFKVIQ